MLRNSRFFEKKQGFIGIQPRSTERGSAIIWVFIMIGLFAALSFAISDGSRSGEGTISKEQADLASTEILDYASAIKRAVQELQINGCSDTEISFENGVVSGYSNPNSPSDESCHVFKPNGAGLRYVTPNKKWLDNINTSISHYGVWYTSAQSAVNGLGIDAIGSSCAGGLSDGSCHELITGVPFIQLDVCKSINKKLGWGADLQGTPYKDTGNSYGFSTSQFFTGDYAPMAPNQMGTASPSDYSGVISGCIEGVSNPASGTYSFFQVLIAR